MARRQFWSAALGYTQRLGKKPLARIVASAAVGVPPEIMGIGPVPAIKAVLERAGLKLDDIGRFEINEAFGAQVMACARELGLDEDKLNVNGGAIAIGHPLGATGIRLALTLARELKAVELALWHCFGLHRRRPGHRPAHREHRTRQRRTSMDIKGQAAIVTGGASGLGAATARAAPRPARKSRCSISMMPVPPAVPGASAVRGVACDVADAGSAAAGIAKAKAAHGAARVLVNCAGIGPAKRIVGRDGPMPLEDFERVIRVNLIGTFNMMRLAAADMQSVEPLADGERGVIVSTASVAAFEGQIGQSAYAVLQRRRRRADFAGGARVRAVRHSRAGDRAGHFSRRRC